MTINFSDLVTLYRKVDIKESTQAECCIEDDTTLSLIENLASDDNSVVTRINILGGKLQVGEIINLEIRQPELSLGWLYDSIDKFIKGDFVRSLPDNNRSKKPYYIKDIKYYSEDISTPQIIVAYKAVRELLIRLENMSSYLDDSGRKIIFVGKQTFELHYDVSNDLGAFKTILKGLANNSENKLKTIEDFCKWLNVDDVNRHSNEKKSILASVLSDIQTSSKPLEICTVIENTERLYAAAKGQFDNYLEDFKYEKFVQKLEENSEKFISRVNDSISKVLSQILALPIAAAAPVILKGQGKSSEIVIYLALLVYATICYFALSTQKAVLDHLESEVNSFGKEGKLPKSLGEKWTIEKKKILLLVDKQTHLYWIMRGIICIVIAYSAFKIFDTLF
ncbi:hypothetical protein ACTXJ2_08340 [Psychrobacter alimentarius]|uniref:hypothetical protein n=1 Tax=Psychrobacter alimentarius TaxID=261164 RepID=UPI003FD62D57